MLGGLLCDIVSCINTIFLIYSNQVSSVVDAVTMDKNTYCWYKRKLYNWCKQWITHIMNNELSTPKQTIVAWNLLSYVNKFD